MANSFDFQNTTILRRNIGELIFSYTDDRKRFIKESNESWDEMGKNNSNLSSYKSALEGFQSDNGDSDFYGTSSGVEMKEVAEGKITSYLYQQQLTDFLKRAKDLFREINIGGAFEKDRLVATDLQIGVFSFDLASQGLYRPMEYLSTELNRLIDPDLVISTKVADTDDYIFTYKEDGKVYILVQQQEGTKGVLDGERESLVFRTRTKKVNLYRGGKKAISDDDTSQDAKFVDLFCKVGGLSYYTPTMLRYRTLPMIMTAYFLQTAGIKCSINSVLASSSSRSLGDNTKSFIKSYPIKQYSQNLDFNEITFEVADPRVFRGRDFKYIASTFWKEFNGTNIGSGLGTNLSARESEVQFEEYKNYLIDEANKGDLRLFNKNKKLMLLSGFELNRGISESDMEELAIEEFFNLVCKIDIQFNGAEVAMRRFFKQQVKERGNSKFSTLARIRTKVLDTAFEYSYSTSKYSDEESYIMKNLATKEKYKEIALRIADEY
tara:strand:+ start:1592 stop:3070 length:1479 start_codon:yes stop_codon:yes gene_type:complete